MFNKTVGFVNAFPAVPKGRKAGENVPILFTVWQAPFRGRYPPHPFRENPRRFAFFPFGVGNRPTKSGFDFQRRSSWLCAGRQKIPSHGSDGRKRKKRQAAQSPVCGFSETACRFSYNLILISLSQSFKRSSTAASKAVFMDFSIMLKISFSKVDCFFFFLSSFFSLIF